MPTFVGSRVLVVDDEKMVRWGLRRALEECDLQVHEAATAAEGLESLLSEAPDIVLLDYRLPDRTGLELLRDIKKALPLVPVVMITAHASIDGAVEAMKEGAYDYISKPFELDDVIQTVARALEASHLREEVARQREDELKDYRVLGMVAESPAMKEVVRLVKRVASSAASTILLLGESGVGKGMVARALHTESAAADRPFMHITCTALPETLLESELFGHEKGAFTDARTKKRGLFELADGGTVFLDEIGDLTPAIQGKLLRFLEDKIFRRVGGSSDIRVNVRIIAATNKDLAEEARLGNLREDLYYRLKVIPVEIPPLSRRVEDIEPLIRTFVQHFNGEFRKSVRSVSPEALERMKTYPWPGNVRELRNTIERAVLLVDGDELGLGDLPGEILGVPAGAATPSNGEGTFQLPAHGMNFEEVERDLVRQALERAGGNRTRAARLLGMNRDQIRYRIQKFGLDSTAPPHP